MSEISYKIIKVGALYKLINSAGVVQITSLDRKNCGDYKFFLINGQWPIK